MTTYEITFNERTTVGKNILTFLEQNKKYIKINDTTKMTFEEFVEKCERARKQYERGECKELKYEDIDKFLGLE